MNRNRPIMPKMLDLTSAIVNANKPVTKPYKTKWIGGRVPARDMRSARIKKNVPITLAPVKLPEIPE